MSDAPGTIISNPAITHRGQSIAIVASLYNEKYVDAMVESTLREINDLSPKSQASVIRVPGAFEIPVVVSKLIAEHQPDAIIALGVILRGETAHADLIAKAVTESLLNLSTENTTPIIHEVLLLDNAEQAEARCLGENLNRGSEAARSALNIAEVLNKLDDLSPQK